ncbi:MAG: YgeY family selenium metabolism-linked hydrolase [bacterium]|nr:YgeY family selenium metabolism-linked hydrolase [bacterium]
MNNNFHEIAKASEDDLVEFLRDIVAIPSLSSDEERVVHRIEREMNQLEFDEVRGDPMGNLIGRVGSGPRSIALDGHVDTVDVSQPALWETDPFDPVVKDGAIFGKGTTDMKGGVASSVYAAALLKKNGLIPADLSLYVTATVQEEDCDGLCWQYLVNEDQLRPDVVVITEPTSLAIYRGQRGRMEIEISTEGISCHGSAPARGINAVYKMADIIEDIERLDGMLKPHEPLGKGSVTISQIRSTSPSLCAVADGCTIHLDRRLTTGETEETVIEELNSLPSVQKKQAKVTVLEYDTPSYTGLSYPTKKYFPSWQTELTHPAMEAAIRGHRSAFGSDAHLGYWVFSTNGVATAGLADIPTVGFGPGHEKWAHAPNERVEIEHLVRAAAFYMSFAVEYCERP